MKFSSNKDINKFVKSLLKSGAQIERGKKHRKLRLPNGRFVVIPCSPSCKRAFQNFRHDVSRASQFVPS